MNRIFDEIIDINERLKEVDALSRQVNLEAMNASLSARAVGEQGRGFAVVARELQRFSRALDAFKSEQILLNNTVIVLTARRMGMTMRVKQLHKVMEFDVARKFMADVMADLDQELAALDMEVVAFQQKMCKLVRRMSAYCRAGQAISKNAMVEAAHCGKTGVDLRKVADAMEQAISRIAVQLDAIGRMRIMRDDRSGREAA